MSGADAENLAAVAARVRARIVEMCHRARAPHLGSSLSCVDILVAAYHRALRIDPDRPDWVDRDRFILSKGHAAPALYATLASAGFIGDALLDTYNHDGGVLPEHPAPRSIPGLEAATGSLGHGLPIGVGMAVAGKLRAADYRVVVCLSDGECNEGSVWEAAQFAPKQGVGSLVAIVDANGWQATARSAEVLELEPLADKWRAFGWESIEVDGHDVDALADLLSDRRLGAERPLAVVARTVKGKGVSFMEDDNNWHYRIATADEVRAAFSELGQAPPDLA